jgi:cellulose synthase operon protein C
MKLSAAQLLKRLEQGEDLEAINASLISPAEQALLRCCAVVRTFDEALVDHYFRPHFGVDKESVPFSSLTNYDFVERVPRTDGVYLLAPDSRKKYYDAWWKQSDKTLITPPSLAPVALLKLSRTLLEYYTALGDSAKLDALIQEVFVDPNKGWETFRTLYKTADTAFALAQCRDLINALRGLENVLGPELAEELNETERYLQAKSSWATEYYQTVSYYDRKELNTELESFLTNGTKLDPKKKWILQLHAPGGMGKTMFVRWLISRRCLPEPYRIPCGRLDFDFVEDNKVSEHRWRLFLDLAREIDAQIPGNILNSLIKKFTDHERILEHQQAQPVTSPTPAQLEAQQKQEQDRETEILFLFGEAIKNAKLDKPILFILDTLEEVILYRPNDLVEIVRLVDRLRANIPNLLLILSGRYDLSEPKPDAAIRVPEFIDEFKDFVQTVHLTPFADEEALGFLQLRGLTKDRPLKAVIEKAEGNPFKLALFADILLDDPTITEETILSFPTADLLYLIKRVLARIPKNLHWLLRYGVVPRQLTLQFVKDVIKPHLLRSISGDDSNDNPQRSPILSPKVQKEIRQEEIFFVESPQHDLDLDDLWTELQRYASKSSWVTIKPSDPYTASFHSDVVNPMRRWLENEPVYKSIHEDAIAYYENKAKDPAEWSKSMPEAVYHAFQLEGVQAANYWRRLMVKEEDAERRRELASEIVGLEYVDDELNPRSLLDGRQIIDLATLAEAYFLLTSVRVEIARMRNAPPKDKLWSDAENSFQKYEQLQRGLSEPIVTPANLASTRAAILTNKGLADQAVAILEEALVQDPDERARMSLELELANSYASRGNYQRGIHYWESALRRAESLGLSPDFTVEMRRNLARLYRNIFELEASAREFEKVLELAGGNTRVKGEALNELVDLYFEMGQFIRANEASDRLRNVGDYLLSSPIGLVRYANQQVRFFTAVGDPLQAVELSQAASQDPDLINAAPEAHDLLDALLVQAIEQRGTLDGILFEIEPARENFERARSRWHERGDTKAVKRCMLKKAALFLNAGDIKQAGAVSSEATRLSLGDDQELLIEEGVINLGLIHFTNEVEARKKFSKSLNDSAAQWRPHLRARLMLRTGAWELSPNSGKAANHFFSDLTDLLRQIQPASARTLLLDPLSEYPSFKEIDYHVAQDLLDLFPLHRYDEDFHVYAPKVVELMRVLGRKDQAVTLLKELMESGPKDNLFAQRRLLLTLGRTASRRGKLVELTVFIDKFQKEYREFPALCTATLIEFAELSFGTRSRDDRLRLLGLADLVMPVEPPAQLQARLLALRGRLTINEDRDTAIDQLNRAIHLYNGLGNVRAAAELERFVAVEEKRKQRSVTDVVTKAVTPPPPSEESLPADKNTTATIHVESNWTESVTINTSLPGEAVKTLHVPIEPESTLDQLLAFETYENYSFAFLRMMSTDWLNCCVELGRILMDRSYAEKLQSFANAEQRKPALSLIIEALQLSSAPWEMMVLPYHSDEPASISPAVGAFYRSLPSDDRFSARGHIRSVPDISWLQLALTQLGPQRILADGIYSSATAEGVRHFQRVSGLPDHGTFDGPTRRALKRAQHANEGRERPRVLLLRPSVERQRASSRGHEVYGFYLDEWYRGHGFKDLAVVEDPDVGKMQEVLWGFQPDVVHICPTMEESTSIGIYLDFGSGGTGVMPKGSAFKSQARLSSPTGDVEFLTLSALSDLMRRHQKPEYARPLLILDVLEPRGRTELFTQLFLRNAFAAQLYQLGAFESIIATGLTPGGLQTPTSNTLIQGIGSFVSIGETVVGLRRIVDLGLYTRLAPVGNQPGPLRDPSDERYLSEVVATAGTALFTQDPET